MCSAANYSGEAPLALPKLNLQFLSPSDYLLRNFHLFRLEAAYEVREDIQASEALPWRGACCTQRVWRHSPLASCCAFDW